jgi:hypothetical protein
VNQVADASGRFRFAVQPGRRYTLSASWRPRLAFGTSAGERGGSATFGPFVAEAEPPPVSLRLSTVGDR